MPEVIHFKDEENHISLEDFRSAIESTTIVDVREASEFAHAHIPTAQHVALADVLAMAPNQLADRFAASKDLVLVCESGARSDQAVQHLGLHNIEARSLAGGMVAWQANAGEIESTSTVNGEQRERYGRQMRLQEFGEEGQAKLRTARVAIVGAGGLGSPVALYLSAAGVGQITIIDPDVVDLSNLHRQILFGDGDVGASKATQASTFLASRNNDNKVNAIAEQLSDANAHELLNHHDIVVDATDNLSARYAINNAAVALGIPVVHGSVFRFEGTVSVFYPPIGPCYECVFPQTNEQAVAPNCADVGVLGSVVGVVGSMQATEAIKLLTGIGESLIGRLATYNALDSSFVSYDVARNPTCRACASR